MGKCTAAAQQRVSRKATDDTQGDMESFLMLVHQWLNAARAKVEADEAELQSLPVIKTKKKWTKKIHPGVSTFGEKPDQIGPDHLSLLVDHALSVIPSTEVANTPIFLLATAGMRLLPEYQRNAILQNICTYFQTHTSFQLPDCALHVQVIPGETEGLYGWIAANYLLGGFDAPAEHEHGGGHHTYGFLDMGGASAQIAFAPNATEAEKHANDLKLLRMRKVSGEAVEYRVFVTTWLGFGVNEARRRYLEALTESTGTDVLELPDPCLPSGLKATKSGNVILPGSDEAVGSEAHLLGTGTFTECLKRTFPLLDKDAPCEDEPCLLHGVHVPAIDFDVNHFVGVSEYWHTTHEVFEMSHKDKAYDFHTYQERVVGFCSQDWATIQKGVASKKWGKKVDENTAVEVCFKASWLINMLHEGIGIPRVGLEDTKPDGKFVNGTKEVLDKAKEKGFLDPFQAVDKIGDTEVSWTLGKMVLYAASQVPPSDETLAVGFGSNTPGTALPKDFQYAGGRYTPLPDDLTDTADGESEGTDWHDRLFTHAGSRRVPGLLLFLLILTLIAFLLLGREKRSQLYQRLRALAGRPPRSPGPRASRARNRKGLALGLGKLFGKTLGGGPSYERVLESGAADFELGAMASDDEQDSTSSDGGGGVQGRTSGWATPQVGFESPALSHSSPRSKGSGYFDPTGSLGLVPSQPAFERGGLMARTESRERLSRSRNASPTRGAGAKSPFLPLGLVKEV
ncbi:Golgi apyrase [Zalaria obscura]|uniref:Golgi apyrase n=1 Tax=Zalaria obscura TaxID=2024903 RepID=A0ACC3SMF1_9PEZI